MRRPGLAGVAVVAFVVACGGGELGVTDAWGRSSPAVADAAAFYISVENPSDDADRLVAASTARCGMVEFHESTMDDEGVMRMRPAAPALLEIPAGGTLSMEPGGLHLMCMRLTGPLIAGETVAVELEFERAGIRAIEVAIEDR